MQINDFSHWEEKYGNCKKGHISNGNSTTLLMEDGDNIPDYYNYPTILNKKYSVKTQIKPKHILLKGNSIFISSMGSNCIEVFSQTEEMLEKQSAISYSYPCIHSEFIKDHLFTTLSKFKRNKKAYDCISTYNTITGKKNYVNCGGSWPKHICAHPKLPIIYVSNWNSNNISVISIETIEKPKLVNVVPCGISPRGMDLTSDGKKLIVACYYSRNVIELEVNEHNLTISNIGEPYNYPNYSGNMRDLIVGSLNKYAYISNMGRGELLKYDINKSAFVDKVKVGYFPTSINIIKNLLLATCSASNLIYVIDQESFKVIGVSEPTSKYPVSISVGDGTNIFTTSFYENCLDVWELNHQKIQTQS